MTKVKEKIPLRPNTICRIVSLGDNTAVSRRLAKMGMLPGVEVTVLRAGALGGPLALGAESGQAVALREEEAAALELDVIAFPLSSAKAVDRVYRVRELVGGEGFKRKTESRGVTEGARVTLLKTAPYTVRLSPGGGLVILGRGEADKVVVEPEGGDDS
ncbi:MAG: FeoA family protein [Candidatus Nitrospinota bacterium M3_3B_026]